MNEWRFCLIKRNAGLIEKKNNNKNNKFLTYGRHGVIDYPQQKKKHEFDQKIWQRKIEMIKTKNAFPLPFVFATHYLITKNAQNIFEQTDIGGFTVEIEQWFNACN